MIILEFTFEKRSLLHEHEPSAVGKGRFTIGTGKPDYSSILHFIASVLAKITKNVPKTKNADKGGCLGAP